MLKKETHPAYRAEIDGLRAFAIILVIFYHAFPKYLRGGFVGVDVFFVISGYLITGIVAKEIQAGTFSFLIFYGRRCRRIIPALSIVLLSALCAGWLLLLPDEYQSLGRHVLAGATFTSNLLLWQESGYFDVASELKPLLHLWSLGIEEQFYIFWPIFLVLCYRLRANLILVSLVLFVMSFGGIFFLSNAGSFYLLPTRFWELLLGGGLVLAEWRYLGAMNRHICQFIFDENPDDTKLKFIQNLKAAIAFISLLVAATLLTKEVPYPGWGTLLPTFAAGLFISAGRDAWINRVVLASKPAVWLGLISYPLYLWHGRYYPLLTLL
jgi:peptidoglycan/LPS O-acetylase OafA/YrhL